MVGFVLDLLIRVFAFTVAACWICISTLVTISNSILSKSPSPTSVNRESTNSLNQARSHLLKRKRRVALSLNPDSFMLPPYLNVYRLEKSPTPDSSVGVTPTSSENSPKTLLFISTVNSTKRTVNDQCSTHLEKDAPSIKKSRQQHRCFTPSFKSPRRFRAPSFRATVQNSEIEIDSSFSPTKKIKKSTKCKKQNSLSKLSRQTNPRMDRHAISHHVASMHDISEC